MQRNGFALAVVIWISAILLAATTFMIYLNKLNIKNSSSVKDKLRAKLICDSTIEKLKFYALTGRFEQNYLKSTLDGFPEKLFLDNREINITENTKILLYDVGNMIYIYNPTLKQLRGNFEMQLKRTLPYFNNRYLDWIDIDNNLKVNGAENSYYNSLGNAYSINNEGTIQDPYELFLVKDLTDINKRVKKEIVNSFMYSRRAIMNAYTIDPKILFMLIDIDSITQNQLKELYKTDKDEYIRRVLSITLRQNYEYVASSPSNLIGGVVTTKIGNSRVVIKFEFDFLPLGDQAYFSSRYFLER